MSRWQDAALLAARLLLAVLFLGGAVQKVLAPEPVYELLAMRGWPLWLYWPALIYTTAAGLALVAGAWIAPVALSLAGYCAVTSIFHLQPEDPWQMTIFVKNWAIAGGCLALAVAGPGPWRLVR
ncbi:DoxX family protein [Pseudoroseicyclus tamaricis]|uniref:DoxX family membrane protein n=1 Tax=Pseudoroseicyclus tamaricis TaxID=2705421 RepID=A0A6B2JW85_9RHOB|nr:DoxX family membrane protein [Pseudoroseicyclus tamaricis]NDV00474.1 DoxX family membrane protein [Pseudoroseicyclus tamaricis]